MVMTPAPVTYSHLVEAGEMKAKLRLDRLLLQSFMAGAYIGFAGHTCTSFAGGFNSDPSSPLAVNPGAQRIIYAIIFPIGFISIVFTGAELFTGNTMTMLMCWLQKRCSLLDLLRNWGFSLIGNWLGALFVAYFLSYLTGEFWREPWKTFLYNLVVAKTSHGWGSCFCRAVGCNTLVCLAVWFVAATDEAAGKIIAMWFPVVAFCLSGYEHLIANFYTLQVGLMYGAPPSVFDVVFLNLAPTLLGNIVGGCILVGVVGWYNFSPSFKKTHQMAEGHLLLATGSRNLSGSMRSAVKVEGSLAHHDTGVDHHHSEEGLTAATQNEDARGHTTTQAWP